MSEEITQEELARVSRECELMALDQLYEMLKSIRIEYPR